jgi:hypothetical protein
MQNTGLPTSSVIQTQSTFGKPDAGAKTRMSGGYGLTSLYALVQPGFLAFSLP